MPHLGVFLKKRRQLRCQGAAVASPLRAELKHDRARHSINFFPGRLGSSLIVLGNHDPALLTVVSAIPDKGVGCMDCSNTKAAQEGDEVASEAGKHDGLGGFDTTGIVTYPLSKSSQSAIGPGDDAPLPRLVEALCPCLVTGRRQRTWMRTLVISANSLDATSIKLREVLRAKVDPQGPTVATFADVERRLSHLQPEMLVVVLTPEPELGIEIVAKSRRLMAGYILAVGHASEPKLILRALRDGADHYVDEAELETELDVVLPRLGHKGDSATPAGRIIALLGSSGGSGSSTLAVNTATVLAKDHGRCGLIDLKPGRGDLATLLDLKPAFHLADLCINAARLDRAMFEKLLVRHASGVQLLAAPQVFADTRLVTSQGVSQALLMARQLFAHVVVDLEDCFHEEQVLTLRQASVILIVSRLDFTSLRNIRRILERLREDDIPTDRVRMVINRYGQPGELPAQEAEEALGGKLAYYVPDDPKTVNKANNAGIPVVLHSPSAKVSLALSQLARTVLERRKNEGAVPAFAGRR